MDAGQQASATQGLHPHGRTEASNFPLVATGLDMVDEDRLVAIRSTVSALQKVRYLSPLAPESNVHLLSLHVAGRRRGDQADPGESSCTTAGQGGAGEHLLVPILLRLSSLNKST